MQAGLHTLLGLSLRQVPQNLLAEQSLLGGIMVSSKNFYAVAEFLRPEHFSDALNGRIFAEQSRRILAGGIADAVSLKTWFDSDPDVAAAGGVDFLTGLIASYVGPGTAGPYGRAIHDSYIRRELIAAGEEVVNSAFDQTITASEAVTTAITKLDAAYQPGITTRASSLDDAMDAAIAAADEAARCNGPSGTSIGFPSIDKMLGGLEDGTLTVLAGRPGMGKSALGWQMAINAARQGIGVLAVSLEMSATELGRRALAAASGVPIVTMKRGTMTTDQASAIVRARREMQDLPLTIEDAGGLTSGMISLKAKAARRRHGLGLIMIDHLHIVAPDAADARQGPTHAVGQISAAMKRLAKEMNCPVLLLAQLNRAVEARDDKRPGLGDLRQSGGIEQDADAVMFVYRPEYYMKAEPARREAETPEKFNARVRDSRAALAKQAGTAELIVAKVRDGETGTISLGFHGPTTSFNDPLPTPARQDRDR